MNLNGYDAVWLMLPFVPCSLSFYSRQRNFLTHFKSYNNTSRHYFGL